MLASVSLHSKNNNDRYNPHKEKKETELSAPKQPRTILPNEPSTQEAPQIIEGPESIVCSVSTTPHSPLGHICSTINEYCAYFLANCMEDPLLEPQKEAVLLFCSLLALLANLADADIATIRLDDYLSNVIALVRDLQNATAHDPHLQKQKTEFPLMTQLALAGTETRDIDFFIYHSLRAPTTAVPLLRTLFNELKNYTAYKMHAVLGGFKEDTQRLLVIAQHPERIMTGEENRVHTQERGEKRNMGALGWLCQQAAHTCLELAQTVPSSPLLAHTGALMQQIHQMLSTMALTYSHLSTATVRSQDRHSLAQQYAFMVEQLGTIAPRRGGTSLLHHINGLANTHERENYIETIFASSRDSELFLAEFFPALTDSLDYNLSQFNATLTMLVIDTFEKRFWWCK